MTHRYLFDGGMSIYTQSVRDGVVPLDYPLKWHELRHDPDEDDNPIAWAIGHVRAYEMEDHSTRTYCAAKGESWDITPRVYHVAPDGVSLMSVRADLVSGETRFEFIRFGTGWTEDEKRCVLDVFRHDTICVREQADKEGTET